MTDIRLEVIDLTLNLIAAHAPISTHPSYFEVMQKKKRPLSQLPSGQNPKRYAFFFWGGAGVSKRATQMRKYPLFFYFLCIFWPLFFFFFFAAASWPFFNFFSIGRGKKMKKKMKISQKPKKKKKCGKFGFLKELCVWEPDTNYFFLWPYQPK